MMPASEQLFAVVQGISNTQKDVRDGAEAVYEREWVTRPASLFPSLLEVLGNVEDPVIKSISAVLLRKAVMREVQSTDPDAEAGHLWTQMDGPLQEQCRAALLQLFERETNADVQHRIADAVAEVARIQSEYGEWPELLSLLFGAAQANHSEGLLMSLMRVLAAVPEIIENRPQDIGTVSLVLQTCINQASGKVRLEAIRALVSIVYVLGDEEDGDRRMASAVLKSFQGIINASAEITASLAGEPDLQSEAMLSLIDLLTTSPKLFKEAASPLASMLLQLLSQGPSVDEDVRKGALELLLTLVENIKKARKDSDLIGHVLNMLVSLVAEVEDDLSDWLEREPEEDDLCEAEMLSMYAEQGLDRLSMDLGGKMLMPHMFSILPQLLGSASWKQRYAGLRTLASVAEGCLDVLEDNLENVLGLVWSSFQDPNPRVQYAACHALGQLCTDFDGAIQEVAGEKALSALVGVLVSSQQPRVQTHAAAALINFAEGVQVEHLAPFLDELLTRLVNLLGAQGTVMYLQSQLMATLGAFSSAAGTSFVRYYGAVVPLLMSCFVAACDPSDKPRRQLQCRALEALSLVFYAIGREHIAKEDLDRLVQHMMVLQESEMADDDEMISFLSTAWSRLCRILGSEMAPLLPALIPRLLEQASQKADLASLDMDESLDAYDSADWQFATVRGKRLGIRTATLDSKLEALQDIFGYVDALQEAYLPVAKETVQVAVPLLSFALHEGIQAAAAELLALLLPLMHAADPAGTAPIITTTVQALLKSFEDDYFNVDYTYASLDALADMMPIVSKVLGQAFLQATFTSLPSLLKNLVDCIQAKLNGTANDDEDDEDDDDMDNCEEEEDLLYAMSRFFAALMRAYGPAAAPFIGDLAIFCARSASAKQASASMRHASLCMIDDMIHWCGPEGTSNHADEIAKALAAGLAETDDTDVRQAALYGVGMAAEHGGSCYVQFIQAVLPGALLPILSAPNAKAPSQRDVTDNAASATGRILTAYPQLSQTPGVLAAWIGAFPVVHDEDEIVPAYRALAGAIRAGMIPRSPALKDAIEPALRGPKDLFVTDPALRAELSSLF